MVNPLRRRGVADVAYEAYAIASKNARIDIDSRADKRVVQAIGDAKASAGYHHKDGTLDGVEYTAAIDLSVKGLNKTQIATWLEELCRAGFVAFYRNWTGNLHIHANYAGLPQKRQLDGQNEDFFAGRDGLVGHRRIDSEWWYPEKEVRKIPEKMFRQSNPKTGAGKVVKSPLALPPTVAIPETPTIALHLGEEAKPRFWMPVLDGVSYAPVRAFGSALGLQTDYDPATNSIKYDSEDQPIALKIVAGVGHAPIRQLADAVGLKTKYQANERKVVVHR